MLTQIDVVFGEGVGEALALPILGVTPNESLLVREVTGLNPPAIDLFIGEYARDGGFYGGRRVGQRNVVFTIDLNPNPALGETVQGLRELLYKVFIDPQVDADYVEFVLHDDAGNKRNLHGYTETFETELFGVETLAQISVICPDPYIRDLVETELVSPTGTWLSIPFTYMGSAETGFEAEVYMNADHPRLNLNNNGKIMQINNAFNASDAVYINTNRGHRNILRTDQGILTTKRTAHPTWTTYEIWHGKKENGVFLNGLIADGVTSSLYSKLNLASPWIELHSVSNTMLVHGLTTSDTVAGIKSVTFRPSYWGV